MEYFGNQVQKRPVKEKEHSEFKTAKTVLSIVHICLSVFSLIAYSLLMLATVVEDYGTGFGIAFLTIPIHMGTTFITFITTIIDIVIAVYFKIKKKSAIRSFWYVFVLATVNIILALLVLRL